jgi:hypothetical protein
MPLVTDDSMDIRELPNFQRKAKSPSWERNSLWERTRKSSSCERVKCAINTARPEATEYLASQRETIFRVFTGNHKLNQASWAPNFGYQHQGQQQGVLDFGW